MNEKITAELKSEEKYARLLIDYNNENTRMIIDKAIKKHVIQADNLSIYNVIRCNNGKCIAVEYNNCNRREIHTIFDNIIKELDIKEIIN